MELTHKKTFKVKVFQAELLTFYQATVPATAMKYIM